MCVQVVVRLSHPSEVEVVLRKRICIAIYKKPSIANKFFKRLMGVVSVYEEQKEVLCIAEYTARYWHSLRYCRPHSKGYFTYFQRNTTINTTRHHWK